MNTNHYYGSILLAASLALSFGLAACSRSEAQSQVSVQAVGSGPQSQVSVQAVGSGPQSQVSVQAVGSELFPSADVGDWASYAEQVSSVVVLSEREFPLTAEQHASGEGYIPRGIRIRIDETVWTADGVTPLTGEHEMVAAGWVLRNGNRLPLTMADSPRLEVGGRYVLPLLRSPEGLSYLSPKAVLPAGNDPIAREDVRRHGRGPVAERLMGRTHSEIRDALTRAPRNPLVKEFSHLPPHERVAAVARAKRERGRSND